MQKKKKTEQGQTGLVFMDGDNNRSGNEINCSAGCFFCVVLYMYSIVVVVSFYPFFCSWAQGLKEPPKPE